MLENQIMVVFGDVDGCGKDEFHVEPFKDERAISVMEKGVGYELVEFCDFLEGGFGGVIDACLFFVVRSHSLVGRHLRKLWGSSCCKN